MTLGPCIEWTFSKKNVDKSLLFPFNLSLVLLQFLMDTFYIWPVRRYRLCQYSPIFNSCQYWCFLSHLSGSIHSSSSLEFRIFYYVILLLFITMWVDKLIIFTICLRLILLNLFITILWVNQIFVLTIIIPSYYGGLSSQFSESRWLSILLCAIGNPLFSILYSSQ